MLNPRNYMYWREDTREKVTVAVRCLYEVDYLLKLVKASVEESWKQEAIASGKATSEKRAYLPSQVMEDVVNDVYKLYNSNGFEIIFPSVLSSTNCELEESIFVLEGDENKAHGMHKAEWDFDQKTVDRYKELYSQIARYEYEGRRFTRGYFFRLVTRVFVLVHSDREGLLELKTDSDAARKALHDATRDMPRWPKLVAAYSGKSKKEA